MALPCAPHLCPINYVDVGWGGQYDYVIPYDPHFKAKIHIYTQMPDENKWMLCYFLHMSSTKWVPNFP